MKRLVALCLVAILSIFSLSQNLRADTPINWTTPGQQLKTSEVGQLTEGILPTQYGSTSIPCVNSLTKVRVVKKYLNLIPVLDHEYKDSCNVPMGFGSVSGSYIQLDGYDGAFQRTPNNGIIIPVPFTSRIFFLSTAGYSKGGALYFNDHLPNSVSISPGSPDKITVVDYGTRLGGTDNPLVIDPASVSISGNGEWLLANIVDGKQVRISTLDAFAPPVIFGGKVDYFKGFDPQVKTAITDDGKYAAVGTLNTHFSLYSIEDCEQNKPSCRKDLRDQLTNMASADYRHLRFKFSGNDRLQMYLNGTYGGEQRKTKIYNFFPSQEAQQKYAQDSLPKYLAMGDSFASGEGAFNYRQGTDIPNNRCHQSLVAYSRLGASAAGITDAQSVACSGAKMKDVLFGLDRESVDKYNQKERQAKGLEISDYNQMILNSFLPGYRQQIQHVINHKPNIVTISISGNDIGFSDKIQTCLALSWSCYDKAQDRAGMLAEIKNQFDSLKNKIRNIKENAAENAKIYVLGYPQFFPEGGGDNCQLNTPFDLKERRLANDLVHDLNQMIKLSASAEGVSYIDVETAMHGHYLCDTGTPAFNGLTAGNDAIKWVGYPLGKESFHPNQLGHQLMKNNLLEQSENFSKKNPLINPSTKVDDISSHLTGFLSTADLEAAKSLPILVNNTSMAPDTYSLQAQSQVTVNIENDKNLLLPGKSYQVSIHSTPTILGSLTADNSGNLSGSFIVPNNLPIGFHELHIIGPTHDGRSVDFYKSIYVASSDEDWDGDGIANDQESCPGTELSGVDYDQDGIDDACDGQIGEPPATPEKPKAPETLQDAKTPLGESVGGLETLLNPEVPSVAITNPNLSVNPIQNEQTISTSNAPQNNQSVLGETAAVATSPIHQKAEESLAATPKISSTKATYILFFLIALSIFGLAKFAFAKTRD